MKITAKDKDAKRKAKRTKPNEPNSRVVQQAREADSDVDELIDDVDAAILPSTNSEGASSIKKSRAAKVVGAGRTHGGDFAPRKLGQNADGKLCVIIAYKTAVYRSGQRTTQDTLEVGSVISFPRRYAYVGSATHIARITMIANKHYPENQRNII